VQRKWGVLLVAGLLIGCESKLRQPTSDFQACVRYKGQALAEIQLNLAQNTGERWEVVLAGASSSTEPFYLFPVPKRPILNPSATCRVTLQSLGAEVLQIPPAYTDLELTPLTIPAPIAGGSPSVIDLPDDFFVL
jgi:hypothetical protein